MLSAAARTSSLANPAIPELGGANPAANRHGYRKNTNLIGACPARRGAVAHGPPRTPASRSRCLCTDEAVDVVSPVDVAGRASKPERGARAVRTTDFIFSAFHGWLSGCRAPSSGGWLLLRVAHSCFGLATVLGGEGARVALGLAAYASWHSAIGLPSGSVTVAIRSPHGMSSGERKTGTSS